MNGTSIRNIKRNQSEMATGKRGDFRPGHYAKVVLWVAGRFKIDEYLKHRPHQKALIRAINMERYR